MYLYDMTRQEDQTKLELNAQAMGRQAAHEAYVPVRSDIIEYRARAICERAIKENPQITDNPPIYCSTFVDAYMEAYFSEVVFLRDQMRIEQPPPGL
jgi:hypothetical protein